MPRLSVRARITVGSVLVAAVLLAAALVVVRMQVTDILSSADTALAEGDLASFAHDITADPTAEVDDPGTGILVYVRNPEGQVDVNTLPHDLVELVAARPAADERFAVTDDEGRGFVVVGQVVRTSAGDWATWSARSTSSSRLALEGLDRVLVVGGVVLIAGFGLASWLLATLALRPVNRMRRRADSLGSALDGDLPVSAAGDELSALARTLNGLLARVRASSLRERQMVSDAAHELRSPLAALRTQLELAHDDAGNADALSAHIRGAEASVDRLSSLAGNLLELSRLDQAESPARESDTAELVGELMLAIDRARMLGAAGHVDITFDLLDTDGQRRYPIDRQAFGRVLDNLLGNAIAAVTAGEREMGGHADAPGRRGREEGGHTDASVSRAGAPADAPGRRPGGRTDASGHVTAALAQDADGLRLSVRDDGPGMPADFIDRSFERFSRPDTARTSTAGGSGLGLALVKAIVDAAGGAIELANRHPGLAVEIRIPSL